MSDIALLDFVELLTALHDAGVVVSVDGRGCLILTGRRGQPVPGDLAQGAARHARLLAWTVMSEHARWHACDVCGLPQLVAKAHACHMTFGCSGHLRPLR